MGKHKFILCSFEIQAKIEELDILSLYRIPILHKYHSK